METATAIETTTPPTPAPVAVDHPALPAALRAVLPLVPKKSPKRVLENCRLLSWRAGFLVVGATDLEASITVTAGDDPAYPVSAVDGHYPPQDVATLIPRAVADMVTKRKAAARLDIEPTAITVDGYRVAVTDDVAEYPRPESAGIPDGMPSAAVSMPFLRLVDGAVSPATDEDNSRYALAGVCLERRAGVTRAVGTDGRRIHIATETEPGTGELWRERPEFSGETGALVHPRIFRLFIRAVDAVAPWVAGKRGRAATMVADSAVVLIRSWASADGCRRISLSWSCGGARVDVIARTIMGRFPQYESCVPTAEENPATAPVAAMSDQFRAAARVVTEQNKTALMKHGEVSAGTTGAGYRAPWAGGTLPAGWAWRGDPRFMAAAADGIALAYGPDMIAAISRGAGDNPMAALALFHATLVRDPFCPRAGERGFLAVVAPCGGPDN